MGKVDFIFTSAYGSENFTSCLMKSLLAKIVVWLKPTSLEEAPHSLRDIEVWTVWREEKDVETFFLPLVDVLGDTSLPMNGSVVENHKGGLGYLVGKIIKKLCQDIPGNGILGLKTVIQAVAGDCSEDVEPLLLLGRDKDVLVVELPAIRNIAVRADVALVSEVQIDEAPSPQRVKFLQLKGFQLNQLRRGFSPWAFSYTLISCANKFKKRLKVESLTSRPELFSHSAFAFFTLFLCFFTASFTDSSSAQDMSGLAPRPPFSLRPSMPSASHLLSQSYMASGPYPTTLEISFVLMPSAFKIMARQRMRNLWQDPCRYAFSSDERCSSLSVIFFVFPIVFVISNVWTMRRLQIVCH